MTMAMAFRYFADETVDIAIIEVGMGGRLDSTNIITPLVSLITNIGMDHMQFLGIRYPKLQLRRLESSNQMFLWLSAKPKRRSWVFLLRKQSNKDLRYLLRTKDHYQHIQQIFWGLSENEYQGCPDYPRAS